MKEYLHCSRIDNIINFGRQFLDYLRTMKETDGRALESLEF